MRPKEVPSGDYARVAVEPDQNLSAVPEPSMVVLEIPTNRAAPGPHGRTFAYGQFGRHVLLDRDRQIQFVVLSPVDDSEAAGTDYSLDGEIAQNSADWQSVAPLVIGTRHRVVTGPRFPNRSWAAARRLEGLSGRSAACQMDRPLGDDASARLRASAWHWSSHRNALVLRNREPSSVKGATIGSCIGPLHRRDPASRPARIRTVRGIVATQDS